MLQILNVLLWNACLAGGLAVVIFMAQRIQYLRKKPHVCHGLWLLVLVKLVTPPLLPFQCLLVQLDRNSFRMIFWRLCPRVRTE